MMMLMLTIMMKVAMIVVVNGDGGNDYVAHGVVMMVTMLIAIAMVFLLTRTLATMGFWHGFAV